MIAISVRFLAGRYHATPWGRHVNEGAIEWPPSPWRILRALVATWKRTLPDLPETEVRPILNALAAPPRFVLPRASTGHTRHYMPWEKNWKPEEPEKAKTKVFDAFVALDPRAETIVTWPDVVLSDAQSEVLARILANLGFLGRSESWCDARLLDGTHAATLVDSANCRVLADSILSHKEEIVRTLCPDPASAFANSKFADSKSRKRGKTTVREEVRTVNYDPDWHLCAETLWLHDQKWSDPPGSRWILYARPRDCFKIEPVARSRAHALPQPRLQLARYALDSTVLPLVTETLPVAEAARRALIFWYIDVRGREIYGQDWSRDKHKAGLQPVPHSRVCSGKDEHRNPLTGHGHAYYLPTDEDGDGRIDHLTVFARDGFGPTERRALDEFTKLNTGRKGEERHPLRALLLGIGTVDNYAPGPLRPSRIWVSATPYIATRHAKTRGRNRIDMASLQARTEFLLADLRSQLNSVIPDLVDKTSGVEITPVPDGDAYKIADRWRPLQFKRYRSKPGDDGGQRLAGAFRIEFPQEVHGPIALGYGCHFGLGLFMPEKNVHA